LAQAASRIQADGGHRRVMGSSVSELDPPPQGGAILWLQQPTRSQCCFVPRPSFDPQRPAHIPISDVEWSRFQSRVSDGVAGMKDERPLTVILLFVPIIFLLEHFTDILPEVEEIGADGTSDGFGLFQLIPLAIVGVWVALRYWLLAENKKKDEDIRSACADLNTALGGQFTVAYRAEYTGFFKPKRARTLRAVVITPMIEQAMQPVPQAMVMGVVVPPEGGNAYGRNARPEGYA